MSSFCSVKANQFPSFFFLLCIPSRHQWRGVVVVVFFSLLIIFVYEHATVMTDPFSSTAAAAPQAPGAEVSRRELNASFHQCVLVLVHTVLYHRRVYPAASFRLVRYAGLAVWQSRHPGVCAWVRTMVESAMQVINKVSGF